MQITSIKQQVKRKDRYSVYLDGKYSFALSESGLLELGLKIGQEVSGEQLEDLKHTANDDKAWYQAISQIARRQRSEWEVQDYLKRKGYSPETIEYVVNKLSKQGYLNDANFAEAWVRNRRLLKHTSQRKLWQELKQKRVADDVINQVLANDETDETQVLQELIERKKQQSRYQDQQKLIAYLLRQGFNYQEIKDALKAED